MTIGSLQSFIIEVEYFRVHYRPEATRNFSLGDFTRRQSFFPKQLAFPNDHHAPATFDQNTDIPPVPFTVRGEFVYPEHTARFGNCRFVAAVGMPVAPVHEYHSTETREDEVWASWKRSVVETVSKTHLMKNGPRV